MSSFNRTRKQRGFSTVELGISCTVFAAMAIITTSSMVESIKSTTTAEVSAGTVDNSRRGLDRLARDVQNADMVLARYRAPASGPAESEDDQILLRVPRFDRSGARVVGEYDVVNYRLSGGANQVLLRRVSRWDGTTAGPWGPTQRLIPGITGLRFDYQMGMTVRAGAVGSILPLPGPVVSSNPDDNEIEILALRSDSVNADREDPATPGMTLPASLRTGASLRVSAGFENRDLDFRFRINPEFVSKPPHGNAATMVVVKIAARNTVRGGGTTTRLVSRFNLRNAQ